MQKTILTIVLAALCLNFTTKVIAQTPQNKAIDVTTKGIQIGQKIPETTALSKYKGKLIILDFWATWCSPCIAMIPKMEALQEQFKDRIQIVPVAYQSEQETTTFLNKLNKGKASNLPQITGDKALHKLFPHIYLPHYVWIDGTGTVRAITDQNEATAINIDKILQSKISNLSAKKDMKIAYNKAHPLFIGENGGKPADLRFHSILAGFTEGLTHAYNLRSMKMENGDVHLQKITATNLSLQWLYRIAYGAGKEYLPANRVAMECTDNGPLNYGKGTVDDDYKKYSYCYELILPPHLEKSGYQIMQDDLTKNFPQYKAFMEKRTTRCLALVRISGKDLIKTKGMASSIKIDRNGANFINKPLSSLVKELNGYYLQKSSMPLVDATGYSDHVDLILNCALTSITAINQSLSAYGLQFIEKDTPINILVIKDNNPKPAK